jgi:hypothetical protein
METIPQTLAEYEAANPPTPAAPAYLGPPLALGGGKHARGTIAISPMETIPHTLAEYEAGQAAAAINTLPVPDFGVYINPNPSPAPAGYVPPLFAPGDPPITVEGSPAGSNPDPVPNGDQPLGEITTLLDVYRQMFAPPGAATIGPSPAPGVTVIPGSEDTSGGGASIGIWLAVLGIGITIALYWWSNHKHKG